LNAFRSRPFAGAAGPLRVTVSAGIASTCPTRESTAQALLAQADEGLLAAKRAGRNCVCEAGGEPPAAAAQEIAEISATETRGRVLIVDDEQSVRDVLGRLMRSLNFATVTSGALDEAYREIETRAEEFDIVLTDLRLGNGTGIDLLQALKEKAPWTVKMVVSGYASKETAIACLRHGAFDFIEKPFAYAQIVAAMDRALEYRRLLVDNRRYQMQLEELVRSRSESLTQALDGLRRSYSQTIQALAMLIEAREAGTGVHCRATREAVRLLAREVGVAPHDVEAMEMGAMLHDIGKIAVPDAVLLKAGPLTDEERRVVRSHARIGHDLLREVPFLYDASQIVLQHHEFYDGTGYPDGLRGDAICLGARVFAVVDAYHAMRSTRCYREEIPEQAARDEIARGAGRQFDPAVVAAFLRCQPEIEDAFRTLPDTPPDFLTTV
jgi:putative nucleotidyltransferase with HDIG domain